MMTKVQGLDGMAANIIEQIDRLDNVLYGTHPEPATVAKEEPRETVDSYLDYLSKQLNDITTHLDMLGSRLH